MERKLQITINRETLIEKLNFSINYDLLRSLEL